MLRKIAVIIIIVVSCGVAGVLIYTNMDIIAQIQITRQPIYAVPATSASAVTGPPSSLEGINTHPEIYGTGADPNVITLGPKTGGCEGCPPYEGKNSMEFEVPHGSPVLAPIDMVFIGFNNRNAEYRTRDDGTVQAPYDDLELYFESASSDWPGMLLSVYHLSTSPLLTLHTEENYGVEEWAGTVQVKGHVIYLDNEMVYRGKGDPDSCGALLGRLVRRGEVIGYAGSVGDHSMAPFRFKVSHTEVNPLVNLGNRYLHWVQPGSFFYWKCYSPDVVFPAGVLAYPFPCDGYSLPAEQYDVGFKYSPSEN